MSQNARESLSALMDGEGDELELRRVLKSLDETPDAADTWRRYHLMRSLMRREPGVDVATDLSAGIMARIEDEPSPHVATPMITRRSIPFGRGAGIAAAVSLMVITGVQFYNGAGDGGDTSTAGSDLAADPNGQAAPASLSADGGGGGTTATRPSLVDLPMFQTPQGGAGQGLMTVGAGLDNPMFMAPTQRQSRRVDDDEQARLLQSYLDRHAEGAAYPSGDAWMPLLRATGNDSLGQR
jgi:sigma-E factor negative regulatory protein RseA